MDARRVGMSFVYKDIGSLEIDTTVSYTFYFLSRELYPCLILFDDLIVEESFFIVSEDDGVRILGHACRL